MDDITGSELQHRSHSTSEGVRTRDHVYHAAMLDPHTAADFDLEQMHALVDDLIAAHGDFLQQFQ